MHRENTSPIKMQDVIAAALETLGLQPSFLLSTSRRLGVTSMFTKSGGVDWDQITVDDWMTLSSLLCLPTASLSVGYQRKIHEVSINRSIEEGLFKLPMTDSIIKLKTIYLKQTSI